MSTMGGYLEYHGRYHDARGGYYGYRGGCSVPWGKNFHYRHSNRLLGHRIERHTCMGPTTITITTANSLALCAASYGTHLKGVSGQLPLYRHCSRPLGYHMGPTCTSVFGQLSHYHHYSKPCGYRVELHMRPAWISVWGSFHTIVTRSYPSGITRLHMGHT